jgi:phytoene/squalene synthetase
MKALFDEVSVACSRITTQKYSNSFSLAIYSLGAELRVPIYSIYGFVRLADEIVDSFHDYDRSALLLQLRNDTRDALQNRISLNPILNSFQHVVHRYGIQQEWIDAFMDSMEMDLNPVEYDDMRYKKYILGSAEVVGLMCLHVFTDGDKSLFDKLKPYAMKLGAAFQKVNFLRDLNADYTGLNRVYFPDVNMAAFSVQDKTKIEADIEDDFRQALTGIHLLPENARRGVYLAYRYYYMLFRKIKRTSPQQILRERVRIPDFQKLALLFKTGLFPQMHL